MVISYFGTKNDTENTTSISMEEERGLEEAWIMKNFKEIKEILKQQKIQQKTDLEEIRIKYEMRKNKNIEVL
ncbi:hypothetical protein RCL_jg6124.t1 [Rhizophagus clarus]|uniref:Uncharacterized protein n=1 Tax=Rhizophagus clarus TaxID=94130 RepID=A0A8H3KZT7_9GLOM|nr:hypothetical protein RCL_jg6124.t1 [Rhizophagus clarus]